MCAFYGVHTCTHIDVCAFIAESRIFNWSKIQAKTIHTTQNSFIVVWVSCFALMHFVLSYWTRCFRFTFLMHRIPALSIALCVHESHRILRRFIWSRNKCFIMKIWLFRYQSLFSFIVDSFVKYTLNLTQMWTLTLCYRPGCSNKISHEMGNAKLLLFIVCASNAQHSYTCLWSCPCSYMHRHRQILIQ